MNAISTRHGKVGYITMGKGAPLVLIHGNTYTAAMQERLARRFADEHEVFCIDLLGHGQSARPDNLFSRHYFAMQGEALADVLAALFPDNAAPVFGMSAGGISALNAICHQPDRIAALILDGVFRRVSEATVAAHHHSRATISSTWDRYMRSQHGDEWWPHLRDGVDRAIAELHVSGTIVAPCLKKIQVPTLIFQGGKDPFVPNDQAYAIVSAIPQAHLVYDAKAGHLVAWRHPDAFRERVRRFLHADQL